MIAIWSDYLYGLDIDAYPQRVILAHKPLRGRIQAWKVGFPHPGSANPASPPTRHLTPSQRPHIARSTTISSILMISLWFAELLRVRGIPWWSTQHR